MMTTLAAVLGGVPLALGLGAGAELRQPLGYSMVGGLVVSQALTLFTTPVVYIYLDHVSDVVRSWITRWRGEDRAGQRERPRGPGVAGEPRPAPAE